MSGDLAALEHRLATVVETHAVIDALRAMAAARLQQATAALAGTRDYIADIREALRVALGLAGLPDVIGGEADRSRCGVLLFGPEHGFVGSLARELLSLVTAEPPAVLMIVGSRCESLAAEHGLEVTWSHPMATRTEAVPAAVVQAVSALSQQTASDAISSCDLVYARVENGQARPHRMRLAPVDLAALGGASAPPPLIQIEPEMLVEGLIGEYLTATLAHAAMETFAAENAARHALLTGSHNHLEEQIESLTLSTHSLRQDAITDELMDLANGLRAQGGA